jgi:hypothetical protein
MCICYRRTAIEHVWQGHLEAALEARDTAHQIFRSQKDWGLFLQGHRDIASDWDLRNTVTASDRAFLAALKIAWEPTYRPVLNKLHHLSHWRFTFWPFVSQLLHACAIIGDCQLNDV